MRGRKQRYSPWPFSRIPLPLLSSNRLVTDTKPKPKMGIRIAVFAILWGTNRSAFFSLNNLSDAMAHYKQSHMTSRPIITINWSEWCRAGCCMNAFVYGTVGNSELLCQKVACERT